MLDLGGEGDAVSGAVLLEDATVDDTLVDAGGLVTALGDVGATVDGLLEHTEVVLALAGNVVGNSGAG